MALAQRSQELQSLVRGLELFTQIGQFAPVQDYIDENGLVKQIINLLGLPAKMIKSDAQVQQVRDKEQQLKLKQCKCSKQCKKLRWQKMQLQWLRN